MLFLIQKIIKQKLLLLNDILICIYFIFFVNNKNIEKSNIEGKDIYE